MSYEHTRFALAAGDESDLSARAAHLLLVLAARADEAGDSFPGVDRLARDLRRDRTNVLDALAELEAAGLVIVTRRAGKVNLYRVPADTATSGADATTRHPATSGADATTLRLVSGGAGATDQWRPRHYTSGASATRTTHELVNELRAPAVDDNARPLRPNDVLRCPNLPPRKNAWCHATCELCHGMGHVYAEQLGVGT